MSDGRFGRLLSSCELEAVAEYEQVLTRLHDLHCVKMYDRVSVHKAFPELQEAFDNVCAMGTFYNLKADHNE